MLRLVKLQGLGSSLTDVDLNGREERIVLTKKRRRKTPDRWVSGEERPQLPAFYASCYLECHLDLKHGCAWPMALGNLSEKTGQTFAAQLRTAGGNIRINSCRKQPASVMCPQSIRSCSKTDPGCHLQKGRCRPAEAPWVRSGYNMAGSGMESKAAGAAKIL